eukprot:CAMPEP_0206130526 /NCGR_PEP_ID=MMETSP1472-20131121/41394_1 /ASSEMBLY_ACC=CAM_ASM_001108 /TAXON_ID=41880 /ORGANISM="Pycnococcus provasolii, Strain RCC251" /LENGTH=69 /DNA_ID=CAMNT_0053521883 /DNA_START=106 /DNA_END=315 /DNA_ORIENTATION=-
MLDASASLAVALARQARSIAAAFPHLMNNIGSSPAYPTSSSVVESLSSGSACFLSMTPRLASHLACSTK